MASLNIWSYSFLITLQCISWILSYVSLLLASVRIFIFVLECWHRNLCFETKMILLTSRWSQWTTREVCIRILFLRYLSFFNSVLFFPTSKSDLSFLLKIGNLCEHIKKFFPKFAKFVYHFMKFLPAHHQQLHYLLILKSPR